MVKIRNDPEPAPIEEWGVSEWQTAYNILNDKYEGLKKDLKGIFVYLHRAIGKIQESIN